MINSLNVRQTINDSTINTESKSKDISSNSFQLALNETSNVKELKKVSNDQPSVEALTNFYEIHQRSQITGVPTNEYNNAVKALGIDINEPFFQNKAIALLNNYDFNTDFPTKEAVLKYGNTDQDSGNRAYMIGNDNFGTGEMFAKAQDNTYDSYVEELKNKVQLESTMQITSAVENIIESEIPTPIISDFASLSNDESNDNTQIQKNEVISTLQLLMSNTNIVSNNLSSDLQDLINKLINEDNQ